MLQRFSRQVLTAGKADEAVADGGGARAGHSIFTSHVLDALEGAAAASEGVITANGVMAYVYDKVGTDPHSHQTPHYGFVEGDGDFVFSPVLAPSASEKTDESLLIQTPSFGEPSAPSVEAETVSDQLKRLIANPADKILLDDFVSAHLRRAVQAVSLDKFPVQTSGASPDEFAERIKAYEDVTSDLQDALILLARWAQADQLPLIQKIMARLSEVDKGQAGQTVWINLGWYPLLVLMYTGGIAALSEQRFDVLKILFETLVPNPRHGGTQAVLLPTISAITDIYETFKTLPGMDRRYTPRSDHMFQTLQAKLEDHLFLGSSYETLFDQFEIYLALVFADLRAGDPVGHVWGPPGRFGWRERFHGESWSFDQLTARARKEQEGWAPLKAGFFGGSFDRFEAIENKYRELLGKIGWM
jgi:hypothetical protein